MWSVLHHWNEHYGQTKTGAVAQVVEQLLATMHDFATPDTILVYAYTSEERPHCGLVLAVESGQMPPKFARMLCQRVAEVFGEERWELP